MHMKRCSTSLVTSHQEIKTTSHPLGWLESDRQMTSVGEGVEYLALSSTAGGNVK